LSTADVAKPVDVGVAAFCCQCTDLPIEALERAVEKALRCVIADGRLDARR
jgi:hypothetical protein